MLSRVGSRGTSRPARLSALRRSTLPALARKTPGALMSKDPVSRPAADPPRPEWLPGGDGRTRVGRGCRPSGRILLGRLAAKLLQADVDDQPEPEGLKKVE